MLNMVSSHAYNGNAIHLRACVQPVPMSYNNRYFLSLTRVTSAICVPLRWYWDVRAWIVLSKVKVGEPVIILESDVRHNRDIKACHFGPICAASGQAPVDPYFDLAAAV